MQVPAFFLVHTLGGLYVLVLTLALLSRATKVDYYNPIVQMLLRLTSPVLAPARQLSGALGPAGRIFNLDLGELLATWLVMALVIGGSILLSAEGFFEPLAVATWAFLGLLNLIVRIYFWALIIQIVASWVAIGSTHPALMLVSQLVEPFAGLFRRVLPPMGGLDFSPILAFIALNLMGVILRQIANSLNLVEYFVPGF